MPISPYDVAQWLYEKSSDEEYAEAFVILDIMRHGNIENGISANDMRTANIDRITTDIKNILSEIIPTDSDTNQSAWWKNTNNQNTIAKD